MYKRVGFVLLILSHFSLNIHYFILIEYLKAGGGGGGTRRGGGGLN